MEKDLYVHASKLKNIDPKDVAIEVNHVTKDYGNGRGIFDINFVIPRGCTFGYCGTNGAGKTTTLRSMMGFIKPDSGFVKVNGMDAWKDSEKIKPFIGYLPGEIAFPAVENGSQFLKIQAEMINLTDMSRAEELINGLQLDPTANLKRMSKGMKQKTALVAALMHKPDIIILDEPTTGLDPLMRDAFINFIKEEKARGATIIMSNHMFDELEETCDYVGFIKDGHLLEVVDVQEVQNRPFREYRLVLGDEKAFNSIKLNMCEIIAKIDMGYFYIVRVQQNKLNEFFKEIKKFNIKLIKEIQYDLEDYFMNEVIGGSTND